MPNRKIVLAVWGSLGDLHPFLAVALELKARGFAPVIASHAEYRGKTQAEGIAFHDIRPSFAQIERELGADLPQIAGEILGRPGRLYERLIFPFMSRSYEDAFAISADASLIVTSSVAFGARLAAETRGIPRLGAVLQPMMFMSAFDPPALDPVAWLEPVLRRLGPRATGVAIAALKLGMRRLGKPVSDLRRELGLPGVRKDPILDGQFSPLGAIGLYSPLLGGLQTDFPRPTSLTGFAFYDSENGGAPALCADLQAFLDSGSAPIVFTLGSTFVRIPGRFYEESLAAARALKRRAVLLVGEPLRDQYEALRADDVCIASYAPYSQLFPHAAAVVHQGGIGTTAQALRAGGPQLIVPFFGDQSDNAARAVRLGLARTIGRKRYTAARTARELGELLGNPRYTAAALAVRARIAGEDGAGEAARIIGALADQA